MHVAVIDPSRTVLLSVSKLLGAQGHVVHPFGQPLEAIAYIKAHREVEAVITSMVLESMSGLELCAAARAIAGPERPLYIILMSSNTERGRIAAALDSGADDFISKPPEPEELYARLRAAARVVTLQRDLMGLADTDALTGLLNRRALFRQSEEARGRALVGHSLAAVMVDIDHFKRINDVYGHDSGDRAIRVVADKMKSAFEIVGRLGGEEFVGLVEGASLQQAASLAEHFRLMIERESIETAQGVIRLTISAGVSLHQADETIDTLFLRADQALYAAKAGGRNRVITEASGSVAESAGLARSSVVRQNERATSDA